MIVHKCFVVCDCCQREVPLGQSRDWESWRDKSWCRRCWKKVKVHTATGRAIVAARKKRLAKEKANAVPHVPQEPLQHL